MVCDCAPCALDVCSQIAGARPALPDVTLDALKALINSCWTRHSHERCTLEDFRSQLFDILVRVHSLTELTTKIIDVDTGGDKDDFL